MNITFDTVVGLFLPSISTTRISFLRAIMRDEKKAVYQYQVLTMAIPHYEEISVKNLYKDAMQDKDVSLYLPTLE